MSQKALFELVKASPGITQTSILKSRKEGDEYPTCSSDVSGDVAGLLRKRIIRREPCGSSFKLFLAEGVTEYEQLVI